MKIKKLLKHTTQVTYSFDYDSNNPDNLFVYRRKLVDILRQLYGKCYNVYDCCIEHSILINVYHIIIKVERNGRYEK